MMSMLFDNVIRGLENKNTGQFTLYAISKPSHLEYSIGQRH